MPMPSVLGLSFPCFLPALGKLPVGPYSFPAYLVGCSWWDGSFTSVENFTHNIHTIYIRIVYLFLGLSTLSGSQSGSVEFRVMDHLVPSLGLSSVLVEATKLREPLKRLSGSGSLPHPPSACSIFMDPQGRSRQEGS